MLTAKKKAFIEYYKTSRNASLAARQAGYKPNSAGVSAYRLLHNDKDIQAIIQSWESEERLKITEAKDRLHPDKDRVIGTAFERADTETHAPTKAKYFELGAKLSGYLNDDRQADVPVYQVIHNELNVTFITARTRKARGFKSSTHTLEVSGDKNISNLVNIEEKKVSEAEGVVTPPTQGANLSLIPLANSPQILNSATNSVNKTGNIDDNSVQ